MFVEIQFVVHNQTHDFCVSGDFAGLADKLRGVRVLRIEVEDLRLVTIDCHPPIFPPPFQLFENNLSVHMDLSFIVSCHKEVSVVSEFELLTVEVFEHV